MKDFDFIIKASGIPSISEPIRNFIDDEKFINIFYKEDDLVRNLRSADRVITDYPSTPTYEARLLGLPVLSLYHKRVSVRQSAERKYGKTLIPFETLQEACDLVDVFLSAPSEEYIIPMDSEFNSPSFLEATLIFPTGHGTGKV